MTAVDTLKAYEARINLHDFDAVAPLISVAASFWFTDGTFTGHAEIRGVFERTWAELRDERYWLEDLDWIAVSEEVAACTYRFCWRAEVAGHPAEGSGRGTTVLRREAADWKIVHEHLSAHPGAGG